MGLYPNANPILAKIRFVKKQGERILKRTADLKNLVERFKQLVSDDRRSRELDSSDSGFGGRRRCCAERGDFPRRDELDGDAGKWSRDTEV